MEKIRKGNDIEVQWAIYAGVGINEAPYDLTGRNLTLYLKNQFGRTEVYDYTIEKHVIRFMYWGKDQHQTGTYSIELVENEGRQGMHTVDECDAFQLVSHSCQTGGDSEGRVECIHLQFRANMGITIPTIGTGEIEVDSSLSLTSENPVQNKVITLALSEESERAKLVETRLEQALTELEETRLSLIEESISALQAVDSNLLTKSEDFETRISKIEELLEGEDLGVVANVLSRVNDLETNVDALTNEVDTIKESVSKVDALASGVEAIVTDVDVIEDDIETIKGDINGVNSDINTLNADAQTEGSVNYKINEALNWGVIE